MYHILCITKEYIIQIVILGNVDGQYHLVTKNRGYFLDDPIHNLPMELHCIYYENLVQLGVDARATCPVYHTWKGHDN